MAIMTLFRVYWGTSNNRSEFARVKANDIEDVIEFAKKEFLKPDTEFYDIDGESDHIYMMIDLCTNCTDQSEENCDFCEQSEYIEIEEDTYGYEPKFETIWGTNEFYDLTDPEQPEKALNWNEGVAKAWEISPQLGVSALIVQTIRDNPELAKAFSKELIEKSKKDLKLN